MILDKVCQLMRDKRMYSTTATELARSVSKLISMSDLPLSADKLGRILASCGVRPRRSHTQRLYYYEDIKRVWDSMSDF